MRPLFRAFDAVVGGFTVGEKAWEGERGKALMMGLVLFIPLLWKRRLVTLALAIAVAALSYYLAEDLHEREPVLAPVEGHADASLN